MGFIDVHVYLRACVHVQEWVYACKPVCLCNSNKCGMREVADDGSSMCCRLSLEGGTQLHPRDNLEELGHRFWEEKLPPSRGFKRERGEEGKGGKGEECERGRGI